VGGLDGASRFQQCDRFSDRMIHFNATAASIAHSKA
jgi:hypothetical protein